MKQDERPNFEWFLRGINFSLRYVEPKNINVGLESFADEIRVLELQRVVARGSVWPARGRRRPAGADSRI